ncbi:hypothetical protein PCO31111_00781 [Pandoraea communis]|uniref:Uncharacterized protein n=1 Tax=Pandoraea communis TaxID=2508297 RepID=A0A5E4SDU8_9BURK|nr:hypothetical protein PCO31111_00781 [Pandoraea communis]
MNCQRLYAVAQRIGVVGGISVGGLDFMQLL